MGVEGQASVRKLRSMGVDPFLVDDRPSRADVMATDGYGFDALELCHVVIKSPGISRYRPEVRELEASGVPVVGGLGLWLQEADRSRVVCITGTKGKSTATAIAAHLAAGLGLQAFAGGNIGLPPYDPGVPQDADLWIIEVSSYQAADVAVSPPVVAVTSLAPDHLPWHGDAATYFRDKLSLCTQPGADLTVAAADLRGWQDHLGPRVEWVGPDAELAGALGLLGTHNASNAAIARACLVAAGVPGAEDETSVRAVAAGFRPLESRLERVAVVDGVEFVDDSLSTNVLPTLAAVGAFPDRRIALIAGGLDRDLDYAPLAEALARRGADTLVLTVYQTGPRIQRLLDSAGVDAMPCADLHEAVRTGFAWAGPRGVVLLSPAAASFDAFDDYRHRGRVFRDAVAGLGDVPD